MNVYPTSLAADGNQLVITWSDGAEQQLSLRQLRDACPCATCRQAAETDKQADQNPSDLLRVLSPAEAQPLRIVSMQPVGNYAYHIQFSDGHNTGIFSFEYLRAL